MSHTRLTPVRDDGKPFVASEDFPTFARDRWDNTKEAYADALRELAGIHSMLHRPGTVKVMGTVTGCLYSAKKARDAADKMVVELQAIVDASRGTR